ncbi:MAG: DUF2948 family protein, partial [Parvularculaceae bacterium]|nr:DUF2948 family protein [Parvularculaceae bacterium]
MVDLRDYKPLRLVAGDADDLAVLSACLQDAIVKVGDCAYIPKQRRFAFVANRFVWECAADRVRGPFARVRVGAHFDDVISVRQQSIRADAKDAVLELLALRFDPGPDGGGAVTLDFAGGGAIRLDVESVNAQMADLTAPWST